MLKSAPPPPVGRSRSTGMIFSGPTAFSVPTPAAVHLISSDLWEAITGERLNPANICQILNYSMPTSDSTPQSLQGIQFVLMSKDRQGSRAMQSRLASGNPADISAIFDALYPNLVELVCDQAANFVIQKMCEVITPAQQRQMLEFFSKDVIGIVDHPISCRVLQRFIETTSKLNVTAVFEEGKRYLIHMCLSQNGNHIVQRFIELLPEKIQEIILLLSPHVVELAIDNCGCRVVQRLFDKYDMDTLAPLVMEVLNSAPKLATNQYGNYVVQNILEARHPEHISILVKAFRGHFYEFSTHKFASNVIEKCIRGAVRAEQILIFTEMIGEDGAYEEARIARMVGDQFGNYVIQRIIEYGTEGQQNAIYAVVYDNYDRLCGTTYAGFVISKLVNLGFDF
jgi:hypothetical protein